jgi:PleD family two-component response regulator
MKRRGGPLRSIQAEAGRYQRSTTPALGVNPVAGIDNRRHFNQTLHRPRKNGAPDRSVLSLIMTHVDFPNRTNDRPGQLAGDPRLRQVARGLAKTLPARFFRLVRLEFR